MVLSTMRVYEELVGAGMPDAQARAMVRIIERRAARQADLTAGHEAEVRFYKAVVGFGVFALVAGNVAMWAIALCS